MAVLFACVVVSSASVHIMSCVCPGFTKPVAQWVTTNLRPAPGSKQLRWIFDLDGIAEMYDSYEDTSMWELLQQPPQGLSVDFVRAERSSFRWEGVADTIQSLGHRVHLLKDAGHVVHQDNPGAIRATTERGGGGGGKQQHWGHGMGGG